jgi:large subunit ribosomal protein L3
MSAGLIAHKIGMSRVFTSTGEAVPVTYLKVEPNVVVRCKTAERDGYNAVVLGVGAKTWTSRKGKEHVRYAKQREWRVEKLEGLQPGTTLTAAIVPTEEATVTVTGVSKGRGFQGVVKRHGMSGGPKTHGSHFHRRPGSIGMRELPGRVHKGKRLPGRMGNDQVTLRGRPILAADAATGVIAVGGPIPGPNGAVVYVTFEFEPDFSVLNGVPAVKETEAAAIAEEPQDAAPAETAEAPASSESPVTSS